MGLACVGFVLLLTPTESLPSPRWRWWARVAAAAPIIFLVALTFGLGLVLPSYRSVGKPLAAPALAGALEIAANVALSVTVGSLAVEAGSLGCASVMPAAWSASSCAGWRSRPP